MSTGAIHMSLVSYTPPKSPMEFIRSEVERGLANGSISREQITPHPLSTKYLSWKERTEEINNAITEAFQSLVNDTKSTWGGYNGSDEYRIGLIQEHKLMRKIIRDASSETKDFYALDIGAGNYQWGRALAKYLNKKGDIPKESTLHIIGIRGETNLDNAVTKLGQCKLYEFGQFQVERLIDEFEKKGLDLINKVDLVVSSWCFRHLVDPLGTFIQTYNLLRPKTGHLLIDGFYFLYEGENNLRDQSLDFNRRMTRLFLETKAPFLTRHYNSGRSLDHFVVRKRNAHPCSLDRQYLGTEATGWGFQIESGTVTCFKGPKESDAEAPPFLWKGDYRGDKDMYEDLRQNELLEDNELVWGPLQNKDADKKTPPFHVAIATGDQETINRCLRDGSDINESDHTGATPLHLAIKHNNYTLFSQLLEKKALTTLFAEKYAPLHLATKHDFTGHFVKDLIQAGADINIESHFPKASPLDRAIKHKNVKAVELLLKAKAILNYENRQLLDGNSTFSSIQYLLPKRLSELEGFDTIIDHIQKGDCVILSYPDRSYGYKFQKPTQLEKDAKIIQVTVNPETRLLDDNNYKEIEDRSDCKEKSFYREDMNKVPQIEFRFGYLSK